MDEPDRNHGFALFDLFVDELELVIIDAGQCGCDHGGEQCGAKGNRTQCIASHIECLLLS
jgi:hypothetical protein